MSVDLTIHAIGNNGRNKPRKPLVQLLATDGYGGVVSVSFHPDDAKAVAKAIVAAAKTAAAGGKRNPILIKFTEHG